MNRKFIMGETFEDALLKNIGSHQELTERDKLNWIDSIPIIENPLSLSSGDLELRLFTYKHSINVQQIRELTTTEERCQNFISRLYKPYELKIIDNIFAIEFTQYDMEYFYNKILINNTKINTIDKNPKTYINPNILNNKRVWRVILLKNINDHILRDSFGNIDISKNIDTHGLIHGLIKLSI
jgi:hypothetical protein